MTYSDRQRGWLSLAFKAIGDTFQFHGRSTTREVWSLYGLWLIFVLVVTALGMAGLGTPIHHWSAYVVDIVSSAPYPALLVRRLHDQGRTGWWALLLTAFPAVTIIAGLLPQSFDGFFSARFGPLYFHPAPGLATTILAVAAVLASFATLFLFLRSGEFGPNRYGPDPRLDPEPAT